MYQITVVEPTELKRTFQFSLYKHFLAIQYKIKDISHFHFLGQNVPERPLNLNFLRMKNVL